MRSAFNLTIANSDGAVIQEMDSSTARDNGFADMSDLFYRARRHAVDLDGALDDLLKELDELSSEKSKRFFFFFFFFFLAAGPLTSASARSIARRIPDDSPD